MKNEREPKEVLRIDHATTIRGFIDLIGRGGMASPDVPNPLTTDTIEWDGRYSSHVANLPSPINLVGKEGAHWSVFLLFPGTAEIDDIDGTPEILKHCNGITFYNFTELADVAGLFSLDLNDGSWGINDTKTEGISTTEICRVLAGVDSLIEL